MHKGNSSDESFIHDSPDDDDSSDDEKPWVKEVRKNYRLMRKNEREKEQESSDEDNDATAKDEAELDEIKNNKVKFQEGGLEKKKQNK